MIWYLILQEKYVLDICQNQLHEAILTKYQLHIFLEVKKEKCKPFITYHIAVCWDFLWFQILFYSEVLG